MKIGFVTELSASENRTAVTPESIQKIQKLGHSVLVQSGAGSRAGFSDQQYQEVGASIVDSAAALWAQSELVAKVRPAEPSELGQLRGDQTLINFFYPAQNADGLEAAKSSGGTVVAMDMVPRISRAQKMDALSSMANVAGYRAVIEAGNNFGRFFTGQVTAAGKIPPAKVLVIGAGVAGLAAIGTAQSLGAIVRAFDVRPEVAEQIESMGAEFLMLDFDEDQADGATTGGYAAPSSPEFREKQLALFREQASEVDIVITTALIPGRDAPKLWLADMVAAMKPGSVVVDLAAERGGNCDLTVADEKIVTDNGVTILGYSDLPGRMAAQSSTLYANNIFHFLSDLTPDKDGVLVHNMEDDVIRGATVAHAGEVTFPPPPPKVQAIAAKSQSTPPPAKSAEELKAEAEAAERRSGLNQMLMLGVGGALLLLLGTVAPPEFMKLAVVFALSCFVGFQVIWNVSHSLHTPLMAVTNAISGIVILGVLLQINASGFLVPLLATISVCIATINIVGGFMVTRRMLQMFQKS